VRSAHIENWISLPRLTPFLRLSEGNLDHAVEIYEWHAELAAACFHVVHHFEVLLRNTVDRALSPPESSVAVESSWLLSRGVLSEKGMNQVESVFQRSAKDGMTLTKDGLISSLPFSFWVHMFGRASECESVWRRSLHRAFPGAAHRKDILVRLESLRKFRNRLAHHDSLLSIDVRAHHDRMLEVGGWVSPEAAGWLAAGSKVEQMLSRSPLPQ
jgi:hypothetical protein